VRRGLTLFSYISIWALLLAACRGSTQATQVPSAPRTLTVYAAASLTDAFNEIGKAFEASHPGVTVNFSFAGSQILRAQIEQGAPADIFASANMTEMDTLVSEKEVDSSSPQIFLTNQLIVILPPHNPANISALPDLSKSGLKIVLAASTVPAGNYALQVLDKLNAQYGADFKTKVLANVVSNETDVKQVVAKVQLGEADAGMVYVSDSVAAPTLQKITIPAHANVIAKYPIAPLVSSKNADLAKRFIAYVLSSDGQATLKKWGFTPVSH
jgi:molybdate transport system substrate-binding protein